MILPLAIAKKLHLLARGEQMPASSLRHAIVTEMKAEGIIIERIAGRTRSTLSLPDAALFNNYLYQKWAITNLADYIQTLENADATRAQLVQASNDSKSVVRRTFTGFLVNTYLPIEAMLNDNHITISPTPGTFLFISDYERFIPHADVVIVGIENAENFALAEKQRYLFPGVKTLFVSRYPQGQSKDLIRWLQAIPNPYLHMGDYDFAGINIFLHEYKKHLGTRASFFIPPNIEALLAQHGNRSLYDKQTLAPLAHADSSLQTLIALIHKFRMGLEQEALLLNG